MKVLLLTLSVFIIPSISIAQPTVEQLVQAGEFNKARQLLPELVKNKPDDASTLYFQGLLEKKGEKALEFFETLYTKYPKSDYADDALMQIGEYRYARGLYVSAERTLLKIPRQYPDSEHVRRAITLLMQSMIVTGKADTARMYLDVFQKRWDDLEFELPDVETVKAPKSKKPGKSKEEFTIQIGAFGSKDNAKRQRGVFKQRGYKVALGKKKVAGKTLHLVWVGAYRTHDDALAEARVLKAKFGVNYGIIDKSKTN